MLVQQVLLFLLMFWVHVLQENPLKHFFQDSKNPTLTQRRHFEQFNCLNWRFYFFLEFAVLAPPAKWRFKLWKSFRKGRHAPRFRKVRKTSEKEKWRNPFSVASNVKARGREIAGKIQNISEIANYINHETRVYLVNRKVSTSLFEILNVFLTFFITFYKRYGKWRKETR